MSEKNKSVTPPTSKPPSSIRQRTGTKLDRKGIADDEFMAAAIGDTEWLRQSLRGNKGAINYDQNVSMSNGSTFG